uniref:Uncharacterized protein n=1 Tax=Aegilops tauschii subsp. strangulata TaxID=200361 RepID=A0A453IP91_AEGTS
RRHNQPPPANTEGNATAADLRLLRPPAAHQNQNTSPNKHRAGSSPFPQFP